MEKFTELYNKSDIIIAHNLTFDKNIISTELLRLNKTDIFKHERKIEFCTMLNTIELCKIEATRKNGKKYYKYPKLSELHQFLFKTEPQNLHDSLVDVYVCFRCFYQIRFGIDYFSKKNSKLHKEYNTICGL